jgi:uncharacterized delta-60 repeat protein
MHLASLLAALLPSAGCSAAAGDERVAQTDEALSSPYNYYYAETVKTDDAFYGRGINVAGPPAGDVYSFGNAVALLPDASVLVAGTTGGRTGTECFDLVHFLASGAIDTSFGVNGHAQAAACSANTEGLAVAVDGQGRVLVAGHYYDTTFSKHVYGVARYGANGNVDTSFGTGGLAYAFSGADTVSWGASIALQSDGKILVGGTAGVARFTANGGQDWSWGTAGLSNGDAHDTWISAIAPLPDGSVIAAGKYVTSATPFGEQYGMIVLKFGPGGSVAQDTFGTWGATTIGFGEWNESSWASGLYVRPSDGSIYVGGTETYIDPSTHNTLSYGAVAKLTSAGAFDATFTGGGKKMIDFEGDQRGAVVAIGAAADGSIVLGGSDTDATGIPHPLVADLYASGYTDTWWGSNGVYMPSFGPVSSYGIVPRAMAISGSAIAVAGTASVSPSSMAAMRLTTTTVLE